MQGYLQNAKNRGIRNILALRGDAPNPDAPAAEPDSEPRCNYGSDLVRIIKEDFEGAFTVAVAGYPSGHPDAPSYTDDLINLKKKVDAGK